MKFKFIQKIAVIDEKFLVLFSLIAKAGYNQIWPAGHGLCNPRYTNT